MTVIFSDGQVGSIMETAGNLSAWTGSGAKVSVVNTKPHHGVNSAYYNGSDWSENYKTLAALPLASYRAYCVFAGNAIDGASSGEESFMGFRDANFVDIALALLQKTPNGTYRWGVSLNAGGLSAYSSTFVLDKTKQYCIELEAKIAATGGYAKLYVEDVLVASIVNVKTNARGNIDMIDFCGWINKSWQMYLDCVVVANAHIGPESTVTQKGRISIHAKLVAI